MQLQQNWYFPLNFVWDFRFVVQIDFGLWIFPSVFCVPWHFVWFWFKFQWDMLSSFRSMHGYISIFSIFIGLVWGCVSGCTYSFWRLGCGFAFGFSLVGWPRLIFGDNLRKLHMDGWHAIVHHQIWSYDPSFKSRECEQSAFIKFMGNLRWFWKITFSVVMPLKLTPFWKFMNSAEIWICYSTSMEHLITVSLVTSRCVSDERQHIMWSRKKLVHHPCVEPRGRAVFCSEFGPCRRRWNNISCSISF